MEPQKDCVYLLRARVASAFRSADQLSKWKQQLLENAETPLFESTDK